MGRITQEDVYRYKNPVLEAEAATAGLPPGYLVGFEPSIGTDGLLTVGAGTASVDGQAVKSAEQVLTSDKWVINQVASLQYYCYITSSGALKVDIVSPKYVSALYYLSHPVYGWRFVLTFYLSSNRQVQWVNTELNAIISAQKFTFAKSVGSRTRPTPQTGDYLVYLGMDPESDQVAGTDDVEIALKRYNGTIYDSHLSFKERPGDTIVDGFISGAFHSGETLGSLPGQIWVQRTNTSDDELRAIDFGNDAFVAVGDDEELIRSTDGGVTWSAKLTCSAFGVNEAILDVAHISGSNWIAVGDLSTEGIAISSDNGATWTSASTNPFNDAGDLHGVASDGTTVMAVGGRGPVTDSEIGISTDNGNTFTLVSPNPFGNAECLSVAAGKYKNQTVWIVTGQLAGAFRSIDNGTNWENVTDFPVTSISKVRYGGGVFLVAPADGSFYRSIDGGFTWTTITNPFGSTQIRDLRYGDGVWIAVAYTSNIAISRDNGATWGNPSDDYSLYQPFTTNGNFEGAAYDTTKRRFAIVGHDNSDNSPIIATGDYLLTGAGIMTKDTTNTATKLTTSTGDELFALSAVANTVRVTGEYWFDSADNEPDISSRFSDGMTATTITLTDFPSDMVALHAHIVGSDTSTNVAMTYKRAVGETATYSIRSQFADGGTNVRGGTHWMPTSGNTFYVANVQMDSSITFRIVGYKVGE